MIDMSNSNTLYGSVKEVQPQDIDFTRPASPSPSPSPSLSTSPSSYAPRYLTQLTHAEHKPVGKQIFIDSSTGGMVTTSNIAVSLWTAETVQVDTLQDMAGLLGRQGSDMALILDHIEQAAPGQPYYLGSKSLIEGGWRPAEGDGRSLVQLKKEFFTPGGWVVLDWDFDHDRPEHLQDATVDQWWERLCQVCPQFNGVGRVIVPSSKSQVLGTDGKPAFNKPSYHIYIRIEHRGLVENIGALIEARFWLAGQGYRRSSKKGVELLRTPVDPCTWSISRRVFESQPVIGPGLGLVERDIRVIEGGVLDLMDFPMLSKSEQDEYERLTKRQVGFSGINGEMRVHCVSPTLSLDIPVEVEDGWTTVGEYLDGNVAGGQEKLRCQTPFRESDSWAGYLNRHEDGSIFLYDVGSRTKYVVPPHEIHSDAITAGIQADVAGEGVVGDGVGQTEGTGEGVAWETVPTLLEQRLDELSRLELRNPSIMRMFIDRVLVDFPSGSLEEAQVKKALKTHCKAFMEVAGVDRAYKDAKTAMEAAGRQVRAEMEREQARLQEQVDGLTRSHVEGLIFNPDKGISVDAVGYPHIVSGQDGTVEAVLPVTQNLRHLCDVLNIRVQRNLMTHSTEITIPGYTFATDDPDNHAGECLKDICVLSGMPTERLDGMTGRMANETQYHPMLIWLQQIGSWDGVRDWLGELCGYIEVPEGHEVSRNMFLRKWLIGGIAMLKGWREHQPRSVLTLAGSQNIGKTSFLRMLSPSPDWFLEGHLLQPGDTDSERQFASHFLCELGEVDSTFRRSDIAALKAFISKGRDVIRLPYARKQVSWKRRTLPCASVNEMDFLVDQTGNSRFWPIECLSFDFQGLNTFVVKGGITGLWQQINALYEQGESWWLADEVEKAILAEKSEAHRQVGSIEQAMLDGWDWSGWTDNSSWDNPPKGWRKLTTSEIAEELNLAKNKSGQYGLTKYLQKLLKSFSAQKKARTVKFKSKMHKNSDGSYKSYTKKCWMVPGKCENSAFCHVDVKKQK